ncbi:uncharacterized protein [Henckelia pumila]|uniref:uncharacterized protein n=1 Tax=Henckelia pumila TaxID=405737 RepID=UPI003C6E2AF5
MSAGAASTAVVSLINRTISHPDSFPLLPSFLSSSTTASLLRHRLNTNLVPRRTCYFKFPRRHLFTVMEWQDSTVKMDVDVPISVAYRCYSDREAISQWMPFISSVKILDDKPDLSRWSLKYKAFGQDIQYSWVARNLQPIPNQKIHWRSLEGLPNRGAVRFFPKGADSCVVELTVSYEVPQLLTPVASALRPFLESLLLRGLEGFAKFAKSYQQK